MSIAQLGDYTFRINPSQVFFSYDVDTAIVPTVGGRVVQAYGATLGDVTVQGLFGQERGGRNRESWTLAEEFQTAIGLMVEKQSRPPSPDQLSGRDSSPMHQPFRFVYTDDTPERRRSGLPVHNWDMMVYIKSLRDVDSGNFVVQHSTGKFSYGYTLTLFIVEDNTGNLRTVAIDKFIERLAEGVGWQRTAFNGMMTSEDLKQYLATNSPDGTLHGLILKNFRDANVPGGNATANQGATQGADTGGLNPTTGQPNPPATPPAGG